MLWYIYKKSEKALSALPQIFWEMIFFFFFPLQVLVEVEEEEAEDVGVEVEVSTVAEIRGETVASRRGEGPGCKLAGHRATITIRSRWAISMITEEVSFWESFINTNGAVAFGQMIYD